MQEAVTPYRDQIFVGPEDRLPASLGRRASCLSMDYRLSFIPNLEVFLKEAGSGNSASMRKHEYPSVEVLDSSLGITPKSSE